MMLCQKIEKAKQEYRNAKPRSARRTEKYRECVMLTVKLLRRKPRKAKGGQVQNVPEALV